MPHFVRPSMTLLKPCGILAVALVFPFITGVVPARAQDLFGFFRALIPPAAPVPIYPPFEYRPGPEAEQPRRKQRTHPKPVPLEQTVIKRPIVPKPPGEVSNPVPALLTDSTLQPGDMVMFPDGLRVFTGRPGTQHKLTDFVPIRQVGKVVSRSTRKLIADLRPGENPAWSTDGFQSGGKLTANAGDVEATGSVRQRDHRRGARPR